MYDITSRTEFDLIECQIEETQKYWPSKAILWICGTKIDKFGKRAVSTEEGYLVASKYNAIFIETSAKDATNISLLFEVIAAKIKDMWDLGWQL